MYEAFSFPMMRLVLCRFNRSKVVRLQSKLQQELKNLAVKWGQKVVKANSLLGA